MLAQLSRVLCSEKPYVDGGDGVTLVLGVLEELEDIIASDDTGLAGEDLLRMVVSCCSAETGCC